MKRVLCAAAFLLFLFLLLTPTSANDLDDYEMQMVVNTKTCSDEECYGGCTDDRLTNKWVFVVDTSSSMRGVFPKARKAFQEATATPNDFLRFAMYTFNNEGNESYRDWIGGSPTEFESADEWVSQSRRRGILSYGSRAAEWAIKGWVPEYNDNEALTGRGVYNTIDNLTVIIISDGAFTENHRSNRFHHVEATIERAQQWRVARAHSRAIIVTIGIENLDYTAGGKPSDSDCQAVMRNIGIDGHGGYFYVRRRRPYR